MVVGNDDPGLVELRHHVTGHEFARGVVRIGVVGLQDLQSVANGDARRHHQEAAGEPPGRRVAHGVDRLPGDDHGHHGGLAGTGGQLEREAQQLGVGLGVDGREVIEESPSLLADLGRHLGQPDHRLHRFHLAEERTHPAECVRSPMLQQTPGLGRDPPVVRVLEAAPAVNLFTQLVDERPDVVLLVRRRQAQPLIEHQGRLRLGLLPGLGDRGHERRLPPTGHLALRRLARFVQLPMPRRRRVRGVQNW